MNTWPYYGPECRREVNDILKEGGSLSAYRANPKVGVGPKEGSQAYKLEREIERKFKVKHAIAVNSGTAGLHAALSAIGVQGRDVVTSPYSFSATVAAIVQAGGRPVFADVDPHHFCLTKESVSHVITKKTAAILPVHLFGYFQDLEGLRSFGLPVIEDACQAVGATRGNAYSGTVGNAGVYSCNGTKNVPAGEGGCLVTNDSKIAEKARLIVNHSENFGTQEVGYNYRIHEVVACIARHGLSDLDERNQRRRDLAHVSLGYGVDREEPENVYYVAPFKVYSDRKVFIKRMAKRGFTIGGGYITPPLNHYPAFRKYAKRELPVVDELSFKTLCLIYDLTPDKPLSYARKMAEAIKESLR